MSSTSIETEASWCSAPSSELRVRELSLRLSSLCDLASLYFSEPWFSDQHHDDKNSHLTPLIGLLRGSQTIISEHFGKLFRERVT